MSETTLMSNLGKQMNYSYWLGDPAGCGVGSQFRVFSQVTITRVAFKLRQNGSPTGSIVARLYTSLGDFQSNQAKPDTQIAQSTNTVDVTTIPTTPTDISFTFNSVVLAPGTYFLVLFSTGIDDSNGIVQLYRTLDPGSDFGYLASYQNGYWQSWWEWN
jgi:hypothetical protein